MKVLVIDVGGAHIKLLATGRRTSVKIVSGPHLTPAIMVRDVLVATAGWRYDAVTIGYPGPVARGKPLTDPHNLGPGWRKFNFTRALRRPVRLVNDAAMQALGSYDRGRMLFLGLGTGLGSATVDGGIVQALELAHLPYRDGKTFEDYLGVRGLDRLGRHTWEKHVHIVVGILRAAMVADHVVLGGGNIKKIQRLPPLTKRGDNRNAFRGGFRVWE